MWKPGPRAQLVGMRNPAAAVENRARTVTARPSSCTPEASPKERKTHGHTKPSMCSQQHDSRAPKRLKQPQRLPASGKTKCGRLLTRGAVPRPWRGRTRRRGRTLRTPTLRERPGAKGHAGVIPFTWHVQRQEAAQRLPGWGRGGGGA